VGAWVNSTQSLQLLLAFICVVFVWGDFVVGCMGKFHRIVAAVASFCLYCCIWFGAMCSATCGCVGKFHMIVVVIASFCLCCVWGNGVVQLCRCMGKFCKIVAAAASFCLCCVCAVLLQCDFVGMWVNSAQSL